MKKVGELVHIDLHQLSKGITIKEPNNVYYLLGIIDAIIIAFVAFLSFSFLANTYTNLFIIVGFFLISILSMLGMKGFYKVRKYVWKDIYLLFEAIFVGAFLGAIMAGKSQQEAHEIANDVAVKICKQLKSNL